MNELGDVLEAEGDLQGARQQFQAALDIRRTRNRMYGVSESQASLAELALEERHPEQAESLLRLAITEFEKEKEEPDIASAYTILSRTLLMQGKVEEARQAIAHAAEVSRSSPDPALKLPIAIQNSRVKAATVSQKATPAPAMAAARMQLRATIGTARRLGYYGLECEARLALGELELEASPALGRSQLATLASESRRHGLELFARQAEAAISPPGSTVAAK
jgi:tetratricopeptide (TPR) repeat protein